MFINYSSALIVPFTIKLKQSHLCSRQWSQKWPCLGLPKYSRYPLYWSTINHCSILSRNPLILGRLAPLIRLCSSLLCRLRPKYSRRSWMLHPSKWRKLSGQPLLAERFLFPWKHPMSLHSRHRLQRFRLFRHLNWKLTMKGHHWPVIFQPTFRLNLYEWKTQHKPFDRRILFQVPIQMLGQLN